MGIVQKQAVEVLLPFPHIMLRHCLLHNNWFKSVIKKIVVYNTNILFDRFRDFQSSHRLCLIRDLIKVFKFRAMKEDIQELLSNLFCRK